MLADIIPSPFPGFLDVNGEPLGNGYIYIGVDALEPITNPITVYWDSALMVPAVQPIRTIGGYPSHAGSPAAIYTGVAYSITVKNSDGTLVYSSLSNQPDVVLFASIFANLADTASVGKGDALIGVKQPLGGAVAHTQHLKNQERVSFWDFMTDAQIADVQAGTLTLDCSAAISTAIAVAIAISSSIYAPAGKYRCNSALTITNPRGLVIEGAGSSLTVTGGSVGSDTVLSFDSATAGTNGITVTGFCGFTMKNVYISQNRGGAGGGIALYLNSGHDFTLDNVKVDDNTGTAGAGIKLGDVIATSVFLGNIKNCKAISHGKSFWSGKANTSLTFENCYSIGGTFYIDGTVYSSFISCASDSSALGHGFTITGNSNYNSSNLTFVGCGAESNWYSAFAIDSFSNCLTFLNPYGAANNQAALTTLGDLFYIDSSAGSVKGIVISAPSALLPNANTFANISVSYNGATPSLSTGNVAVHGYNTAVMTKGIKAQTTPATVSWASEFLTLFGDTQGVARLEAYSQYQPIRIYSLASGGGLYTSYTEELITLTAATLKDTVLGQGDSTLTIFAKNRILGWSFRIDTALASSDGGTTFSIISQAGFAAPVTLVSGLTFTKNTKWTTMSVGLSADQLTTGTVTLRIQCDGGKTFSAGGQVRAIVYRERILDMDNAI